MAISGLGSHAFGSWKDRHSSYMWLRDALPQYLPNARIFIYGYDSKLAGSHSFQNLSDLASRFRASLRVALGSVSRDRPLIFIAHSLGGLVRKNGRSISQSQLWLRLNPSHHVLYDWSSATENNSHRSGEHSVSASNTPHYKKRRLSY